MATNRITKRQKYVEEELQTFGAVILRVSQLPELEMKGMISHIQLLGGQ